MEGWTRVSFFLVLILLITGLVAWVCWRRALSTSSSVETRALDFSSLQRTGKPNDFLVCPPGLCKADSDETSPVFEVSALRLQEEWSALVSEKPRTRVVFKSADQLSCEQRSLVMGFPDTISALFRSEEEGRSTLAVYSRSQYGYWDFGVNRRRVLTWLAELEKRLDTL